LSIAFAENRFPSRIRSGAGFFGAMLYDMNPKSGNRFSEKIMPKQKDKARV
jgi:hypothetical protein